MHGIGFSIGTIEVDPDQLQLPLRPERYELAPHRFIVEIHGRVLRLFLGIAEKHRLLVQRFKLNDDNQVIVGGGRCLINREGQVVLCDYSGDYGAVPVPVAESLGAQLETYVHETLSLETSGVLALPKLQEKGQSLLTSPFWTANPDLLRKTGK